MATLRQKKNGIYFADYHINGKRMRRCLGTSKRIAELAVKDIEVKIAKGQLDFERKDEDLINLFNQYRAYSKTNHSPATQKRYTAVIDHFKTFLEDYPHITKISQLDPKLFENYKTWRVEEEAHNKTINFELQTLRAIFALAKTWGYIKENPTDGIKRLKITNHIMPRFLKNEECEKLLGACNDWEYPIFYTFLYTGMRKSELLNLEWAEVDFDRRKIRIKVKESWRPKTDEREISISSNLLGVLQKLKDHHKKGSLVFQDEGGGPIENNRLRKRLMSLTKKCGFSDVTKLHTLRHTFASHLVMKGVDLPTVSKLMGHKDIDTTMIYSHLADDHVDKAVEKLDF